PSNPGHGPMPTIASRKCLLFLGKPASIIVSDCSPSPLPLSPRGRGWGEGAGMRQRPEGDRSLKLEIRVLLAFLVPLAISFGITSLMIRWAPALGLVDIPSDRK